MVESAKRKFAATEKCENCKVLIKELRVKQQTLTNICSDECHATCTDHSDDWGCIN